MSYSFWVGVLKLNTITVLLKYVSCKTLYLSNEGGKLYLKSIDHRVSCNIPDYKSNTNDELNKN